MIFRIVNLGCKVNRVESDGFAVALQKLGGTLQQGQSNVDLVIVNTCTVTGQAEKKARKAVRRELRDHEHALVVATGCAAAVNAEEFEALDERVVVIGKFELGEALRSSEALGKAVGASFSWSSDGESASEHEGELAISNEATDEVSGTEIAVAPSVSTTEPDTLSIRTVEDMHPFLRAGEGFPTRVGIKIQDGCNNACTYCIVRVARGKAWSRPLEEVLNEFRMYADAGVHEIVLTGINLGTYRATKEDGTAVALPELLSMLLAEHEGVRIRLSSIEPRDVTDELIRVMAQANGRIARHLHIPLQAGSNTVLKEMNRPYRVERFMDLVERLYAAMPMLSLSTDIIVGFPGETEQDFLETLDIASRCRFSKIHVFPYSQREGTPAAARSDQISPQVKAARAAALGVLADELRAQAYSQRVGTTENVLVETKGQGMTESYFEIPVPYTLVPGQLVAMPLPTPNSAQPPTPATAL